MFKLLLVYPFNEKLLQVESSALQRGLSNYVLFEPLTLGIIAALTNEKWEVTLIDEGLERLSDYTFYAHYDLVGITSDTCTFSRAIDISKAFRKMNVKTVIGGIHASFTVDMSLEYFDVVAVGEAELVWPHLINDFENDQLKRIYKPEGVYDLGDAVKPRRNIYKADYPFSVVYTSRGCPNKCNFCAVSTFFGKQQRHRSIDNIIEELKEIPQGKTVFFSDDDIIGYALSERKRAIELFKRMMDEGLNLNWHAFASLDIAYHDDVLEYAAKSGCRWLYIGVDAINELVLKEMNKTKNLSARKNSINRLIKKINSYGILVYGGFIIGNDNDTKKSIKKLMRFIKYSYVNGFALFVLTPLPGTELFRKMENEKRLLYTRFPDDWTRYNLSELTFRPKNFSIEEFQQIYEQSQNYLNAKYIRYLKSLLTLFTTRSVAHAKYIYNFYKYSIGAKK